MRPWMIDYSSFFLFLYIYNVFCAPVAKQEQFIAYALDSLCRTREKNWKIPVWIVGPTQESHETKKLQTSIPLFFTYMYMYDFGIKHKSRFSFFSLFSFFFLTDIDKCKTYPYKCHVNALCNNTHGSHVCTCKPGYTGDGRNCTGTVNNLRSLQVFFSCWKWREFLSLYKVLNLRI